MKGQQYVRVAYASSTYKWEKGLSDLVDDLTEKYGNHRQLPYEIGGG